MNADFVFIHVKVNRASVSTNVYYSTVKHKSNVFQIGLLSPVIHITASFFNFNMIEKKTLIKCDLF